jgi:hypothetical protein
VVRDRLVWHVWHDEALVVVSGDQGQLLAGVGDAARVTVTMRSKDGRTRLVTWTGDVERVDPDDPRWEGHAAALLAVRLNLLDPRDTLERWRSAGVVVRVTPSAVRSAQELPRR